MKIKGIVELYQEDPKTGLIYNRNKGPNILVRSGKQFILDEITDNDKWNGGLGIRSIAIGISTDTNTGVLGPNTGRDLADDGPWQGPSEDDWRLSSEFARSLIIPGSTVRSDESINIFAQFNDAQFEGYDSGEFAPIREVGLFLGTGEDTPEASPLDDEDQKPDAMVGRRIYYGHDDENMLYVDAPYYKIMDGVPLTIKYTLEML